MKWFKRRQVKTDDQMISRQGAKALMYQYSKDDPRVVHLAQSYLRLLNERADVIVVERDRLVRIVAENQGLYGPEDWGRGYYDAMNDAMDIIIKGA